MSRRMTPLSVSTLRRATAAIQCLPMTWVISIFALNVADSAQAASFSDATRQLGSPQPCADTTEGCYSHAVGMVDLDADGDLDLVFANGGGYYQPGTTSPMALYLNDGRGNFSERAATLLSGFTGRVRQVAIGDIDGDSDIDLIYPDAYGLQADAVFINQGGTTLTYREEGALRLGTTSRAGATRLGDLDGDGDLDLMVTDWGDDPPYSAGTARVYLNDGQGFFDEKVGAVPDNTQTIGTGPIDLDLQDLDGDFDLDLLIASRDGDSLLFFNDGRGMFVDANVNLPAQPGPYVYGPDACDVDGDGDLDLWMDNGAAQRREQLLINNGKGVFTDESRDRIKGTSNLAADDNEVQCVDVDGDGDFDVMIASLSNNERILLNDGKGLFTLASNTFPKVSDSTLGLDVGDVSGDGLLDVVTAQGESGSFLNRLYLGTDVKLRDARVPRIRAAQVMGESSTSARVLVAISDQATSDVGARLSAVTLETSTGVVTRAHFVGGDLYRGNVAVSPSGVLVRACAVDRQGNRACSNDLLVLGTLQ